MPTADSHSWLQGRSRRRSALRKRERRRCRRIPQRRHNLRPRMQPRRTTAPTLPLLSLRRAGPHRACRVTILRRAAEVRRRARLCGRARIASAASASTCREGRADHEADHDRRRGQHHDQCHDQHRAQGRDCHERRVTLAHRGSGAEEHRARTEQRRARKERRRDRAEGTSRGPDTHRDPSAHETQVRRGRVIDRDSPRRAVQCTSRAQANREPSMGPRKPRCGQRVRSEERGAEQHEVSEGSTRHEREERRGEEERCSESRIRARRAAREGGSKESRDFSARRRERIARVRASRMQATEMSV